MSPDVLGGPRGHGRPVSAWRNRTRCEIFVGQAELPAAVSRVGNVWLTNIRQKVDFWNRLHIIFAYASCWPNILNNSIYKSIFLWTALWFTIPCIVRWYFDFDWTFDLGLCCCFVFMCVFVCVYVCARVCSFNRLNDNKQRIPRMFVP